MKEVNPVRTFEDRYRIIEWVKNNDERLKGIRPTFPELVTILEQALGLQAHVDTVRSLVKLSGVTWEKRRGAGGGAPAARSAAARLDVMEARMTEFAQELSTLRTTIKNIETGLGLTQ